MAVASPVEDAAPTVGRWCDGLLVSGMQGACHARRVVMSAVAYAEAIPVARNLYRGEVLGFTVLGGHHAAPAGLPARQTGGPAHRPRAQPGDRGARPARFCRLWHRLHPRRSVGGYGRAWPGRRHDRYLRRTELDC